MKKFSITQTSFRLIAIFFMSIVLAGCGSGGGDRAGINNINNHNASGAIGGDTLTGVTINVSGAAIRSGTTDNSGNYNLTGLGNGNYTLTPSKFGFRFNPSSVAVSVNGANVNVPTITATSSTAATYLLTGTVTGEVIKDVLVTLSGTGSASTTTNASGEYNFIGLPNGTYSVAPSLSGYIFSPISTQATINGGNGVVSKFISNLAPPSTFSISGVVSGATKQGVNITLSGAASKTTTTNSNGNYNFSNLENGNYTVAPDKNGFTFNPNSAAAKISGASVSGPNFIANNYTAQTYALSGSVTGDVTKDVLITLSPGNATTTTNSSGNYSFFGLGNGTYTATPSLAGYTFSPSSSQATIKDLNALFSNFASTRVLAPTYSIDGVVSGDTKQGVTINLTGDATLTTTSDANGNFSFTGLYNGNFVVTPVKVGFTFSPSNAAVSINSANISGPFFSAVTYAPATYNLSGTMTGAVTNGVLITLSGKASGTTTTNASGNYSFSGLADGNYTATPSLAGYSFSPSSANTVISGANSTFSNFNSSSPTSTYTISGLVTGAAPAGVTIKLSGAATLNVTTDLNGNYSFTGLSNGNFIITPAKTGLTFSPTSASITVNNANYSVTDFVASSTGSNPGVLIGGTIQNSPLNLTAVVSTFAGSQTAGSADGTGNGAMFDHQTGITTDGYNLYISDYFNYKIRKIVIATGVVTTLAGSGVQGSSDGTGLGATFSTLGGITTDRTNLFVVDTGNNKIRKIVIATGVVSTLAGSGAAGASDGAGLSATFDSPTAITNDGSNLYVSQWFNNKIRKIVISTGVVSTFAGSGISGSSDGIGTSATFNTPQGLATDGVNLYVADQGSNKIRKIVISTATVSTVAGTGISGTMDGIATLATFNQPYGILTDGSNLFVSELGNHTIRQLVPATGIVSTVAGSGIAGSTDGTGTAAAFNQPFSLTSDGSNLYVSDRNNNKIRKIQ